jgi:hypothetical protein
VLPSVKPKARASQARAAGTYIDRTEISQCSGTEVCYSVRSTGRWNGASSSRCSATQPPRGRSRRERSRARCRWSDLNIGSPETWANYVGGFKQGFGQVGYIDGTNVTIEYRWARGQYDRLPGPGDRVGGPQTRAGGKSGDRDDSYRFHFRRWRSGQARFGRQHESARRQRHRGHNDRCMLEPKRLELLREVVPKASVIHMLVNPNNAGVAQDIPEVAAVARSLVSAAVRMRSPLSIVPAGISSRRFRNAHHYGS